MGTSKMKWPKSVEFLILGIGRGTTSIHGPSLGVFLDPPLRLRMASVTIHIHSLGSGISSASRHNLLNRYPYICQKKHYHIRCNG